MIIKNVKLIDEINSRGYTYDLLIRDGCINNIANKIKATGEEIYDMRGLTAVPGIADIHVHLREPGFEYKETIESGVKAAISGGVTTICAMPNTEPCLDNEEQFNKISKKLDKLPIKVYQSAAINKSLTGQRTDWESLYNSGAIVFTNDGYPIQSEKDLQDILQFSQNKRIKIAEHPEMIGKNEKEYKGEAELIKRDLEINREIGGKIHFQHVSLSESIDILENAKKEKIEFTAETCPHYFSNIQRIKQDNYYNVYPPLRKEKDVESVINGIKKGLISIISSDHAPHTMKEKENENPSRGFSGTELLFLLTYNNLFLKKHITIQKLIDLLVVNSHKFLNETPTKIRPGTKADLFLFDPEEEWIIDESSIVSKGKNSAFLGHRIKGRVKMTIADGKIVYRR